MPKATEVAVFGYPSAGKTHFLALLHLHLIGVRNIPRSGIKDVGTEAGGTNINGVRRLIDNTDRLRRGLPVQKTLFDQTIEDAIVVDFSTSLFGVGADRFRLPIVDNAGEILSSAMGIFDVDANGNVDWDMLADHFHDELPLGIDEEETLSIIRPRLEELFQAEAYIMVMNLVREIGAGDGDLKYSSFIQNLKRYRSFMPSHSQRPKGIALVFTFYDEAKDSLETKFRGTPTTKHLTSAFAFQLSAEIRSWLGKEPAAFISYCEWKEYPDPSNGIEGEFEKIFDEQTGLERPKYPFETYNEIVEWLHGL